MSNIWIVGAGPMTMEYIKVLEALDQDYLTVGRGPEGVEKCAAVSTRPVVGGGLAALLATQPAVPEFAIVAVPAENLAACTESLVEYGVKNILVEKPAGLYQTEIDALCAAGNAFDAHIMVAYNRRFYASVLTAQEMMAEDGGPTSCHFEFTEWSHVIRNLKKPDAVLQNWFLGNSTHVVDLAFHLIGAPTQLSAITHGGTDWHGRSAVFVGAGMAGDNVPFSYHANWEAPGRWALEVLTRKNRYIFKPMEELRIVKLGTVAEVPVALAGSLDQDFKPGLFVQVDSFLRKDFSGHCSIGAQRAMLDFYRKMANYH